MQIRTYLALSWKNVSHFKQNLINFYRYMLFFYISKQTGNNLTLTIYPPIQSFILLVMVHWRQWHSYALKMIWNSFWEICSQHTIEKMTCWINTICMPNIDVWVASVSTSVGTKGCILLHLFYISASNRGSVINITIIVYISFARKCKAIFWAHNIQSFFFCDGEL